MKNIQLYVRLKQQQLQHVFLFGKVCPGQIGGKDRDGQKQTISLCILKDFDSQLVADDPIDDI